jgi:predicted phosphate transport protein (TIGR00153 family)
MCLRAWGQDTADAALRQAIEDVGMLCPGRASRSSAVRLFTGLMPREGKFFELFNQHAALLVKGGLALNELLQSYDDEASRAARIAQIDDLERAADRVTHDTVALLHKTFVTPFDRDDIHRLISRMDDILDLIQDAAESLMLYDVRQIEPEARHLADLVKICCERLQAAIGLLSSMKNAQGILMVCQEIDGLESDADRVMRGAISKLFRNDIDVSELIKLQAIYQVLEAATDKCQDVANVIEGVVLENG